MAIVYTFAERDIILLELAKTINHLRLSNRSLEKYRKVLAESVAPEEPWVGVELNMVAQLAPMDYARDRLVEILTDITFTYDNELYPLSIRDFSSVAVDVDDGTGKAVLTANGGTPFEVFDAADVIEISNAESSLHNGTYTVFSTADLGAIMTLTTVLPGSDNAADTRMHITLKAR